MNKNKPVALIILDGFGHSSHKQNNAIAHAKIPHIHEWLKNYPNALIKASGTYVGLPQGYVGNSEVGHLTIGAGRVCKQPITQWFDAIADNSFFSNPELVDACDMVRKDNGALHIMGLLSDAGVHAHEKQIYATIKAAAEQHIKKIFVHAFLDGRDTPPESALHYLNNLKMVLKEFSHASLGSIHGRFFAMDRDHNWDRTEYSYRVLTEKQILTFDSPEKIIEHYANHGITDEFIPPTQINPKAIINNGDGIIFCNVRPDRARQLTESFVMPKFNHFTCKPIDLTCFVTPVVYGAHIPTTPLFPQKPILQTLKDQLAAYGKTIYTIAETEKYAHVTYFFRGENEKAVATETRVLIPSIKARNYINTPEMSAPKITATILKSLKTNPKDFYLINYANADMVGHSGNFGATIKAVECLDRHLKSLYDEIVTNMDGTIYITADHGKAEDMYDETLQQPRTGHTANPVPCIVINNALLNTHELPLEQLADIAPFILKNMDIPIPHEMERKPDVD